MQSLSGLDRILGSGIQGRAVTHLFDCMTVIYAYFLCHHPKVDNIIWSTRTDWGLVSITTGSTIQSVHQCIPTRGCYPLAQCAEFDEITSSNLSLAYNP